MNDWSTELPSERGYYWYVAAKGSFQILEVIRVEHAINATIYVDQNGGVIEHPAGNFKRINEPEFPR